MPASCLLHLNDYREELRSGIWTLAPSSNATFELAIPFPKRVAVPRRQG
ncbi:MAG TPA: hypothetical protein V6D50_09890 [Chroococcales cyanobacterium]